MSKSKKGRSKNYIQVTCGFKPRSKVLGLERMAKACDAWLKKNGNNTPTETTLPPY